MGAARDDDLRQDYDHRRHHGADHRDPQRHYDARYVGSPSWKLTPQHFLQHLPEDTVVQRRAPYGLIALAVPVESPGRLRVLPYLLALDLGGVLPAATRHGISGLDGKAFPIQGSLDDAPSSTREDNSGGLGHLSRDR